MIFGWNKNVWIYPLRVYNRYTYRSNRAGNTSNQVAVKSKVAQLDKWSNLGQTKKSEKVPFSPGESGTFDFSHLKVSNHVAVKSKVAQLDKWNKLAQAKNFFWVFFKRPLHCSLQIFFFNFFEIQWRKGYLY